MLKSRPILPQRGSLIPAFPAVRLDSISFNNKSSLEIHEQFEGSIDPTSISTLKKCMYQIWQCISNNAKVEHPVFTGQESLHNVLDYIIGTFGKVKHPDSQYTFAMDDYNSWFIREYREVSCGNGLSGAAIPTNWFIPLKKKNRQLHDLLLNTFIYMNQKVHLDYATIDQNGHWGEYVMEQLSNIMNGDDEYEGLEKADCIKYSRSHIRGNVHKTFKLLTSKKKVTAKQIKTQMLTGNGMIFKFKNASKIMQWCDKLITFLENECYSVRDFDYCAADPDCEEGSPIFYSDTVGFYWHVEDPYFKALDNIYGDHSREFPVCDPTWYKNWYKDKTVGNISSSNWPADFFKLCNEFNNDVLPLIEKEYEIKDNNY